METTVKNIGILFIGALLFVIWGFYHTFFRLYATFHNANAQHLQQIVFALWFIVVVAQLGFIQYKKQPPYKILKSISFLLAPLVMLAIYFTAKEQYMQDIVQAAESEAIARQTLCLPNMLAFGILYTLAIQYKQSTYNYIRYTIAGALLLVGLGLSHVFMAYIHFPFGMGVSLSFIITALTLLTLMMNDRIYGHPVKPYLISLVIVLATHLIWFCMVNTFALQHAVGRLAQLL